MSGSTVLISPLNWGFGHAGRMIPLALELRKRGNEVIFGADADLLPLIEGELPGIRLIEVPGLHIRYSRLLPQYVCIFLQMPKLILSAVREHSLLKRLAQELNPDVIVSDSRFGFYHRKIFSVYVTHQLRIPFPWLLRFMEPLAAWLHRKIISRYDLCLVPDYPGPVNLSGRLSHDLRLPGNVHYMGPLSRFRGDATVGQVSPLRADTAEGQLPPRTAAAVVQLSPSGVDAAVGPLSPFRADAAVGPPSEPGDPAHPHGNLTPGQPCCSLILSGPEPQRSLLLEKVSRALRDIRLYVLSAAPVQNTGSSYPNITFIIKPDAGMMRDLVSRSTVVIARAGYTSVMELVSLGKGAVLIPTPGQTEQEYLGEYLNGHHGFMNVRQSDTACLPMLVKELLDAPHPPAETPVVAGTQKHGQPGANDSPLSQLPDCGPLFEEAVNLLLERK